MGTRTIAGKVVQVNEEGYLTDPSEWNKDIGIEIAGEEGLSALTEAHWKVIDFCREAAKGLNGKSPTLAADHHRHRKSRRRSCSPCSPRARPRRWPASPAWVSPKAASNRSKDLRRQRTDKRRKPEWLTRIAR